MGSPAKFWPAKLFRRPAKSDADAVFVPRTAMAARIIGKAVEQPVTRDAPGSAESGSADAGSAFDSFTAPPALPLEDQAANDTAMERQADRFVPTRTSTTLTDKRGKQQRARIINVSATGVAIEADFRLMPPDSITMVGAKPVTAGRSIRGGHVFVFDKPLDPARCNPQVHL